MLAMVPPDISNTRVTPRFARYFAMNWDAFIWNYGTSYGAVIIGNYISDAAYIKFVFKNITPWLVGGCDLQRNVM